ncbi:phage tail tape measure protein [Streptomyces sp. WAC08241]|uniref:phage tail tape measure protein n=1 Tax=Streptomyces sp. WAC08241 TaxID=2487421 RepID=UPI000F79FA3D|nr:phage tail tape measure protein [Streptomyces sp. WAC08241]RSS43829.1 phage tail tape measure protein [Streptomyces sp. WAC08241]
MANWNLSVDLRATGTSLARELRQSATHARTLGTETRQARTHVVGLGRDANAAARHVRSFGNAARTAARDVARLGNDAQRAGVRLGRYGDAARNSNRHLNALGSNSRSAGRDLARMSGQIDSAVRDLNRLAAAAQRAAQQTDRVGARGAASMRRYANETGRLRDHLKSTAALLSGGALVMGGAELIKHGNEYQQAMNTFGAVTSGTAMQMQRAAATAAQLGNDLSLPGATATDAAESMVELAKAGFRTDQAINATRASLTLASAAQVNAADSAKYLGDMMDQFGMGADKAGVAADTLAATANAASGDIIDIYYSMKYAGPVAHGLGVSMQEAATGVGMLGKAGILGQTAGTTLRGIFTNLAKPTKLMREGLAGLGIEAWTTQGKFKGLRYIVEKLGEAEHHLSQKDFTAAVAKAFGKPAMSGAIALAHQGTDSYDALIQAVSRTGAASDIAAAKGKGLAGAMLQLKTQATQTGLSIYNGAAPGIEYFTRAITSGLADATPKIEKFFKYGNDFATLFGPGIAADLRERFGGIGDSVKDMLAPFKGGATDTAAAALHVLMTAGKAVLTVLENLAAGVEPIVTALGDVASGSGGASAALDTAIYVFDHAVSVIEALSGVLSPIGHMIGGLVSAFGALPGPVQSAVLAMLLMRRVGPMASNLAGQVSGRLTGAYRTLNQEMALQRSLAAASGASLGRYGAAFAVLQARVGFLGQMTSSFRTASAQATGFAGSLRGVAAAAGTGLARSMSGLMGVLGGGWGLALTAATVGLGMLASRQQKAAAAAREHETQIANLSAALRESNGIVDDNVRQLAMQDLMSTKIKTTLDGQQRLVDVAKQAKIPMSELVDAYTNQGSSLKDLKGKLDAAAKSQKVLITDSETGIEAEGLTVAGRAADDLRAGITGLSDRFKAAQTDAELFSQGVAKAGKNTTAYDLLKRSVGQLADKTADADTRTRALREALDLLSGGSVSLQAAQARVNEAVLRATESMSTGIDKAEGYGEELIGLNGAISTTTRNGQQLFDTFNTIADASASAAVAAYDFAISQNQGVPAAIQAAQREMQKGRDAALKVADGYNIGSKAAATMADSMGLIPGQVSILLQTKGVDTALAEIQAVQAEYASHPNQMTVKVDVLGEEAQRELKAIGYEIELIPGTREYKITAPTAGARRELDLLAQKLASTNGKTINMDAATAGAVADLEALKAKVANTKGKTITMNVPTAEGRRQLEALGFKIQSVKGKTVTVSVPTGGQRAAVNSLGAAINALRDRAITITTSYVIKGNPNGPAAGTYYGSTAGRSADGNLYNPRIRAFAGGGVEQHTAQISRPMPTYRIWAEPETGGEAYIPLAPSKRPRSRAIAEETIRRLGGDPDTIAWYADGGIQAFAGGGFSYAPTGLRSTVSDVQSRYDEAHQPITREDYNAKLRARANAVDRLREAEAKLRALRRRKHTGAQEGSAERKVAAARRSLATATEAAYLAQARYNKTFSLADWARTLRGTVAANNAWETNLRRIASRGGTDVIGILRDMGEEGAQMVAALAKASNRQFNEIVANLRRLGPLAKASLADLTAQLNTANRGNAAFQQNLATLSARGYGDLASMLAGQGDDAAMKLAAEAVRDKRRAAAANASAKTSNRQLSQDELATLIQVIAAVRTAKTGLHDVAAATGLGEDEIITISNKASGQIKKSLGSRATKFLADLARANRGLSYADGGIREGIYSTRGGAVTFAEPSTGGEAYIPLGGNKRSSALPVLHEAARRMGVGVTDLASRQVIVVRESGDTFHVPITAVRPGATAAEIASEFQRQTRRARRGGVATRG